MSKCGIVMLLAITSIIFTFSDMVFGFGNEATHPALTNSAAGGSVVDGYLKEQLGMANGVQIQLRYQPEWYQMYIEYRLQRGGYSAGGNNRTVLEWLKGGSVIEDEDLDVLPLFPSIRPRHHFHDPIRNVGLDNKFDHPNYSNLFAWATHFYPGEFDVTGQSAIVWAIEGTAPDKEPTINNQSWGDARNTFHSALTDPNSLWREYWFAATFLQLGSVLHMIEDMGVPAHVRNDFLFAHYQPPLGFGNPFEVWVEKQVIANNGQSLWSGTGAVVFDKLAGYFDANTYAGGYLGDGIWPPESLWGLSECTNYQFLSLSTMFGCSGVKYQFPHPAKDHTAIQKEGNKTYFTGYGVPHLARESYSYYKAYGYGAVGLVIDSTNTTNDDEVFVDYANTTIPRTIDYTTGLINYFFRGRLSVEPNWADANIVELAITNDSNNSGAPQFLKGGTFELYWDDGDGNRAVVDDFVVSGWQAGSTLDYNDTVTATFTRQDGASKYVLVYVGDICENTSDTDPNDPNAIAVSVICPGFEIAAWGRDDYGQVNDVPSGSDFIAVAAGKRHCLAIKVDGSLVGWGYNNHGECDVPAGNDYVDIAAGVWHSIALKSDGSIVVWGDDGSNQITDKPDGNDFVAIAAGDYHSLALKSDGSTIVCWGGWNTYGECDAPAPDTGTVYTEIAAGKYHSLALQSDGTVRAWGSNNKGQTRIYDGAASEVQVAVAACDYYSLLLRDDEMLIAWGGGDWLEPGIPRYHYRQPDGTDFVAIAAGWDHILALTSDGEILSWDWPQGDYPFDYFSRFVPDDLVFTEDISAGYDFSVALKLP